MNPLALLLTLLLSNPVLAQNATSIVELTVQCPDCSTDNALVVMLYDHEGVQTEGAVLNTEGASEQWQFNYGTHRLVARQAPSGDRQDEITFESKGGDDFIYFVYSNEEGVTIQESSRRQRSPSGTTSVEVIPDRDIEAELDAQVREREREIMEVVNLDYYLAVGYAHNYGSALGAGLGDQFGKDSTTGYRHGGELLLGLCTEGSVAGCLEFKGQFFDAYGRLPRHGYFDTTLSPALGFYLDTYKLVLTGGYQYNAMGVKSDGGYWYRTDGIPVNMAFQVYRPSYWRLRPLAVWLSMGVTPHWGLIQGDGLMQRHEFGGLYWEASLQVRPWWR